MGGVEIVGQRSSNGYLLRTGSAFLCRGECSRISGSIRNFEYLVPGWLHRW